MGVRVSNKRSFDLMNEEDPDIPCGYSPFTKKIKGNSWMEPKIEKVINKPCQLTTMKKNIKINKHVLQKLAEIQLKGDCQSQSTEKLFSVKDLNDIVQKAIVEHEQHLREAHNNTLSQHIYEQMGALSKFNQEFVSQRLRNSEFDYMS